MQLKLFDLVEDFEEVLEKDVRLLVIQDVMVMDYSSGLHAKLCPWEYKLSLASVFIFSYRLP